MSDPKLNSEDKEVLEVAKALGVDLNDNTDEKEGKNANPQKMATEAIEKENRDGETGKSGDDGKGDVDYKKLYSESTKEFQTKYKPLETKLKAIEQLAGKNIDTLINEYQEKAIEPDANLDKKDSVKSDNNSDLDKEVSRKLSLLEKEMSSVKEAVGVQQEKEKVLVKKTVDSFKGKYNLSDDDYTGKISPLLEGVSKMRKPDGSPYALEEGLELAYIIVNKDNINKVVDTKIKIQQKEQELAFAPKSTGKSSSEIDTDTFTQQQKDVAANMGVELTQ